MTRDAFRDIAPLLDAAFGSVLDTPLGHLLGDYMMALERHLPAVKEADFARLTECCWSDGRRCGRAVGRAASPSPGAQIDLGRKERVRQAVRRHLRTPNLRAEEP